MCLIGLAWQAHPDISLIVAANRDEFHARPSAPSAWWRAAPQVFGGSDLQSGGTWMGVTRDGRFAALTNVRDPGEFKPNARTRGALVADFLTGQGAPDGYVAQCMQHAADYNGFNLLTATHEALWYCGNRGAAARALEPGVYAMSNALLDTPWPKVIALKLALGAGLQNYAADEALVPRVSEKLPGAFSTVASLGNPASLRDGICHAPDTPLENLFEALFHALGDTQPQPDHKLPQTGVPLERERVLSSPKIISSLYGTRASTVLCMMRNGQVHWEERSFTPSGEVAQTVREQFSLAGGSAVTAQSNARTR